MKKIIVIGAGAAGLMAAAAAAGEGAEVLLLEQNEKAGKKIYITGKGRCNYTNACPTEEFFDNVPRNPKFLYSSIYGFDQSMMTEFLEKNGCPTKVERGQRAFPVSDHASDVTKALLHDLKKKGVAIRYNTKVSKILTKDLPDHEEKGPSMEVTGVRLSDGSEITADCVITATGGVSYPSTGSTGDGYRFAKELGLAVTDPSPSLVPFETEESWVKELQGLALKNISLTVKKEGKKKPVYEGFGELLFTHFGISGPLVLSASAYCDFAKDKDGYTCSLDLKPALSMEQLQNRLLREFEAAPHKELANALRPLFPERLAGMMARLYAKKSGTPQDRRANSFHAKEIEDLAGLMKGVPMRVIRTRGFNEAIITRGGVGVRQIDPSTMECKSVKGLYFAGEVLDVDALTGGFNLQIAWSTGHLAGESAANA